jgi:hypothetical protein
LFEQTSQPSDSFNLRLLVGMVMIKFEDKTNYGGTRPAGVTAAPTPSMQPLNSWRMEEKMRLCQSEKRCDCQLVFEQLREIRELRELVEKLEAKAANQAGKSPRRRTSSSGRERVRNDTIEVLVA